MKHTYIYIYIQWWWPTVRQNRAAALLPAGWCMITKFEGSGSGAGAGAGAGDNGCRSLVGTNAFLGNNSNTAFFPSLLSPTIQQLNKTKCYLLLTYIFSTKKKVELICDILTMGLQVVVLSGWGRQTNKCRGDNGECSPEEQYDNKGSSAHLLGLGRELILEEINTKKRKENHCNAYNIYSFIHSFIQYSSWWG